MSRVPPSSGGARLFDVVEHPDGVTGRTSRNTKPGDDPDHALHGFIMLDCSDFLEDYSGFRDGTLSAGRCATLAEHLDACASCARYDRVIRNGVDLVRDLPEIEPSHDFLPRLQHRIYHLEDDAMRARRASGASAVLISGIALAIGATAWAPLMRSGTAVVELPPIVAHAPHKVEALQHLFRAGPLLTEQQDAAATRTLFHEYSPMGRFASTPLRAP